LVVPAQAIAVLRWRNAWFGFTISTALLPAAFRDTATGGAAVSFRDLATGGQVVSFRDIATGGSAS
jgi:hypothetical protein